MANISEYLTKIRTAIYGEEVRGSIYLAIDMMNYEAEQAMEAAEAANRQCVQLQNNFDGLQRKVNELSEKVNKEIDDITSKIDVINADLSNINVWLNRLKDYAITDSNYDPTQPVNEKLIDSEKE